ncbi:recombinase family protein [Rhodococcus sp. 5A-K4]|uniref:recombinase family protein n=1 Tax=Rhodococcus sp. 5A-K4 TaxID=3384442 RepID=UPI0038D46963
MRTFIYCRISADREGAGLGVERQREDCERLAEALGWEVIETYADNDISAYSGKRRPDYEAMLDALKDGRASAVIAWHTDRMHRSPAELETFIGICEKHSVIVRTVQAGELDLSTPTGQMTARIVGAVARHEIDHARKRMTAAHAQSAVNGKAHGRVPYGYRGVLDESGSKIVKREPDEKQAPVVLEIADRILAGESMWSIARDLNDRGVPPGGKSKAWRASLMVEMIQRPTYAGIRTHKGEKTPGQWQPIITVEQHDRIVSILSDPRRKTHQGSAPKHLLSGIATCGECQAPVIRLKNHGYSAYSCDGPTRCVSRRLDWVNGLVEQAIIEWCEAQDPADLEPVEGAPDYRAEERALQARLDEATDGYANQVLTLAMLTRIKATIEPQIAEAQRRARESSKNPLVSFLVGAGAAERWSGMTIVDQRSVVRSLCTVSIRKSGRGKRRDPDDIVLAWL